MCVYVVRTRIKVCALSLFAAFLVNRLSSLTDLFDLSSKYLIAFFTMWARFCLAEAVDDAVEAAVVASDDDVDAVVDAPAAAGGGLSGSSTMHCNCLGSVLSGSLRL